MLKSWSLFSILRLRFGLGLRKAFVVDVVALVVLVLSFVVALFLLIVALYKSLVLLISPTG